MDMKQEYMRKKYDAIPSYEEVKLAMNSELTEKQIKTAGLTIKQAVIDNQCVACVDLIGFTQNQAHSMLRLFRYKGYPDCNIVAHGNTIDCMMVRLNPPCSYSKED
ncbi:hypothetical protein [Levilactobacillus brevis]|uniref:hypothetical protein n=1 Tax=Levilactobacillus brevis TaxID=1580 RepID=UPI000847FFBD|nr:hypothetical protein [Levilactobacillus brevis]ODP93280.1 hypothetical protein BGC39_02230 [Levilactobacillus brevis]